MTDINEIDYKKALGTLKEFIKQGLNANEMNDLKKVTEEEYNKGGSEFAIIAKFFKAKADKAVSENKTTEAAKYFVIATKAEQIDKKMENNGFGDGEFAAEISALLKLIEPPQPAPVKKPVPKAHQGPRLVVPPKGWLEENKTLEEILKDGLKENKKGEINPNLPDPIQPKPVKPKPIEYFTR